MPLQTRRRWYVTVQAPKDQDLEIWMAEQDETARDAGYLPVAIGPVREVGDLRLVDVTYEEAPADHEVSKRAKSARTTDSRPGVLAVTLVLVLSAILLYLFTAYANYQMMS